MWSRAIVQSLRRFSPAVRPVRHGYLHTSKAPPRLMPVGTRYFSSGKSDVDATIEQLQDMYATARDEFEMAMEETEGNTVYAADDRQAAREEFDKFKKAYVDSVNGPGGQEIESRIGTRVRELENGVKNMEELAQNQD